MDRDRRRRVSHLALPVLLPLLAASLLAGCATGGSDPPAMEETWVAREHPVGRVLLLEEGLLSLAHAGGNCVLPEIGFGRIPEPPLRAETLLEEAWREAGGRPPSGGEARVALLRGSTLLLVGPERLQAAFDRVLRRRLGGGPAYPPASILPSR